MTVLRRSVRTVAPVGLVLFGVTAMIWLVEAKPAPEARAVVVHVPAVAVQTVIPRTAVIPVMGYGTVRPKIRVQIVPQVSGELVFSHSDLAEGKIIAKGALLFELDPAVYQSRVQQSEAEVRALEATLARHDQEMTNLDARIIIAEKMLAIDEQDYLISKQLLERERVGTQQSLDGIHQKYLQRQDLLVQLTNQRATAPHLKRETDAKLDAARARLFQVRNDLRNTKIFCPFTALVESVKAYRSQMVTAHLSIATLTDMAAFEIPVSVDPRDLRWLDQRVRPQALAENADQIGPEVKIAWSAYGQEATWRGHVSRFARMDEVTRTVRMIVEVPAAEMAAIAGASSNDSAPAISIGMHCRVELPAAPLSEAVLIPWHAIYEDRWVFVVEPALNGDDHGFGRLASREVSILRTIGDDVLIDYRGHDSPHKNQIESGEQLVVSRMIDPVDGMRVALQSSLESARNERDKRSPAAPAQSTTLVAAMRRPTLLDCTRQGESKE